MAINAPVELQIAIDEPSATRALLVTVGARLIPHGTRYPDCVGFSAQPEVVRPGPNGTVRIVLRLKDEAYAPLFEALCDDVTGILDAAEDGSSAIRLLFGRLGTWQRFAARFGVPLSDDARIGLFGELWFLHAHCLIRLTPGQAVSMWRGPLREAHDFRLNELSVEVKTAGTLSGHTARIANLQQLTVQAPSRLLLLHITLSEADGGQHLPALIGRIRERLRSSDLSARDRFNALLNEVGYLDAHIEEYSKKSYVVAGMRWFDVGPDFPRIRASDVPPLAVSDVSYTLNLDACQPFELAEERATSIMAEHW